MFNRLHSYLEKNCILHENQYGFRSNYSTSLALIRLLDRITDELDNKRISVGVFIDLSKAFDTINHDILLKKMEIYGIRGVALDWFRSYLHNRRQYVSLGSDCSITRSITCGVPQGSILGPLLFILYVNDVVNVSHFANIIMFADDTNLFFTHTNISDLIAIVNNELDKIATWFKLNKLSLNIKKTSHMIFHSKRMKAAEIGEVKIDSTVINRVKNTKFLGVIINDTLSWEDHVKLVKRKVNKNIGVICRVSKCMPRSVLLQLYYNLISPYFEYCNIVWAIDRSTLLNELLRCQKKALRTITLSNFRQHTRPLFVSLKVLPVSQLNDLQVACFMYRCANGMLPRSFCSMYQMNATYHSYHTRTQSAYHYSYCRLNLRKNTVRIYGVRLWNSLDSNLRCTVSLSVFKNNYKEILLRSV